MPPRDVHRPAAIAHIRGAQVDIAAHLVQPVQRVRDDAGVGVGDRAERTRRARGPDAAAAARERPPPVHEHRHHAFAGGRGRDHIDIGVDVLSTEAFRLDVPHHQPGNRIFVGSTNHVAVVAPTVVRAGAKFEDEILEDAAAGAIEDHGTVAVDDARRVDLGRTVRVE